MICVEKQKDKDREALIKVNIAVIYFHNCEYRKSCSLLEDALLNLKESESLKPSETRKALFIKIYANLCIIYIVLNKYEESKEVNETAIEMILNSA